MRESALTERIEQLEGFIEQLQHKATWHAYLVDEGYLKIGEKLYDEDLEAVVFGIAEYIFLNKP